MPEAKTKILVVDDDLRLRDLLHRYLTEQGFSVRAVADAADMNRHLARERYDLMVLDLMLPGEDGLSICRRLRGGNETMPIIMLTAKGDDADKIVGLDMGAADYLAKPYNPRELVSRVKAVLRRTIEPDRATRVISVGNVRVDIGRREVAVGGKPVELRTKEFDLLVAFAEHLGLVLDRETLLRIVWGYDYLGDSRTIDVHVTWLRDKLADASVRIQTIRGIGYKLVAVETADVR
jgi:two-component system phosphate regulon response regulator OmpR